MTWRLVFAITLTSLVIVLTLMMSLSHNVVWMIMSHVETKVGKFVRVCRCSAGLSSMDVSAYGRHMS